MMSDHGTIAKLAMSAHLLEQGYCPGTGSQVEMLCLGGTMKRCRMSNDPLKKVVGRQLMEDGRMVNLDLHCPLMLPSVEAAE